MSRKTPDAPISSEYDEAKPNIPVLGGSQEDPALSKVTSRTYTFSVSETYEMPDAEQAAPCGEESVGKASHTDMQSKDDSIQVNDELGQASAQVIAQEKNTHLRGISSGNSVQINARVNDLEMLKEILRGKRSD
jgi:hypothetical protein